MPSGGEVEAQGILARFGLQEAMLATGMVADDIVPPVREVSGLELRSVADVETRQAVADINAISYDLPVEWGREIIDEEAVWPSTVFGSVGYSDGKAVSTATTLILEGIRYVMFVATLPECRQRGYAEATMRHSLERALAGTETKRTVLHATPMGRPSYERMGYRSVATYRFFMLQH